MTFKGKSRGNNPVGTPAPPSMVSPGLGGDITEESVRGATYGFYEAEAPSQPAPAPPPTDMKGMAPFPVDPHAEP